MRTRDRDEVVLVRDHRKCLKIVHHRHTERTRRLHLGMVLRHRLGVDHQIEIPFTIIYGSAIPLRTKTHPFFFQRTGYA